MRLAVAGLALLSRVARARRAPLAFVVHDGDLGSPLNGGGYAGEPYGEGPELVLRFDAAR